MAREKCLRIGLFSLAVGDREPQRGCIKCGPELARANSVDLSAPVRSLLGMKSLASGVLSGLICLAIGGCGASPWLKALDAAAGLQDESISGQSTAKAIAAKQAWLTCNALSVLLGERAQQVLDARAAAAKGIAGADAALVEAERAAALIKPLAADVCALARQVAAAVDAPAPTPASAPVMVPVVVPPPTASPVGPAPSVGQPAGAVPPVGASSPVAPAPVVTP